MEKSIGGVYLRLVFVMIFWGTAFVSGRMLSQIHHPYTIAFLRFFISSLFLLPLLFFTEKKSLKVTPLQGLRFLLLGCSGVFLYNYFFFSGLKLVEAGRSSVIIATNPTFTSLFAALFLGEKLTRVKVLGVSLALFGALTVISEGHYLQILSGAFSLGELYILGAVASWVAYTLLGKWILQQHSAIAASAWACALGTLLLFPFALQHGLVTSIKTLTWLDVFNWMNLGFFSTFLGFIWYYQGVHSIGASRASTFINLVPIAAVFSGVLILHEKVPLSLFAGGLMVILGILLVNNIRPWKRKVIH